MTHSNLAGTLVLLAIAAALGYWWSITGAVAFLALMVAFGAKGEADAAHKKIQGVAVRLVELSAIIDRNDIRSAEAAVTLAKGLREIQGILKTAAAREHIDHVLAQFPTKGGKPS